MRFSSLELLGWNSFFEAHFHEFAASGLCAGRVALEHRGLYRVWTIYGDFSAEVSGGLRHEAEGRGDLPATGDWVALTLRRQERAATIYAVLPRRTQFVRKVAGRTTEEQIVAANVDTVFLVAALDDTYNPRRIERYLVAAWESGAAPVILLTKSDLSEDVAAARQEIERLSYGTPVHAISVPARSGLGELDVYLKPGCTLALLGPSGAGKSTLVNYWLGAERQKTQAVRGDGRGRHTTTHRELILLPSGALVLDTPGMRELQLWDSEEGLELAFSDMEEFARSCRFRDCRHEEEPGCGVRQALSDGKLDPSRYENYLKMRRELDFLELRQQYGAKRAEKKRWKGILRAIGRK